MTWRQRLVQVHVVLNFGKMWQNGQLVCSTVQEGLIRLREIETQ